MRGADRKRTVSVLPLKHRKPRRFRFDPFRRLAFELANQVGDGDGLREPAKDVYMIVNTTNDQRRRIELPARTDQIGMELSAEVIVFEIRLAEFRREHKVGVELDEGLRHRSCSRCKTPSAYGVVLDFAHPGCATRPSALEYNRFAVRKRWPRPSNSISAAAAHQTRGPHRGVLYAEGVTSQSPGSRRGKAAKRTLGYRPQFPPYAEGVTCQSPGSRRGKAAQRTLGHRPQFPPYAEGVSPQSPGSRRGKAAQRTLGYGSQKTRSYAEGVIQMPETTFDRPHKRETGQRRAHCVTPSAYGVGGSCVYPGSRRGQAAKRTLGNVSHNTQIPRRGFTYDGNDNPTPTRPRNGTTSPPMCNAFGVWDVFGFPPPRVRREPRLRRVAPTLGFGM